MDLETESWDARTHSLHVNSVGRAISSGNGSDMVSNQFEQNFSDTFKNLDDVIVVGLDSNLTASCKTEEVVKHGKNGTDQYTSTLLKSCPPDDSGNMAILSEQLQYQDVHANSVTGVRLPSRYEPLEPLITKFDQQFAKSLAAKKVLVACQALKPSRECQNESDTYDNEKQVRDEMWSTLIPDGLIQ